MTASVADLLDRLHRQAFAISNLTPRPSGDRWRAQAIVWPKLAQATVRAMRNVPSGRVTDQEFVLADAILQPIARNTWLARTTGAPVTHVPPDRRLVDMTRVLGGIADLLTTGLHGVGEDPVAVVGLRANLLSPLMVAANWTLATAPDVLQNATPRRYLKLVAGIGAAFAFIPPVLRSGPYDDIAAVPRSENSLDAAIHNWLNAAREALATRKGLSGVTLQTVAADLSVICGAAAATTNAAIVLGQLDQERGRPIVEAMADANAQWRAAARWPQTIYLGGVRDTGLADASTHLRQTVVGTLRDGKAWADPELIAKRMRGLDLLAVARRAMHAAHEAGGLEQAAITNLFWGKDRVMMASRSLEGAAHMTRAVFEARRRGTWIPMPRFEPSGLEVYRAANNASSATFAARQLAVATAKPVVAPTEPAAPSAIAITQGRIAAAGASMPAAPTQLLSREPQFGMGGGGPAIERPGAASMQR